MFLLFSRKRPGVRATLSAIGYAIGFIVIGCGIPLPTTTGENPRPTSGSTITPTDDDDSNATPPLLPPGSSDSDSSTVQIKAAPVFCCNPLSIDFEAVMSDESEGGTISEYKWDFGDSKFESGRKVVHTYGRPGNYSIELVVEGADGTAQLASLELAVGVVEPLPPTDSDDDSPPVVVDDPADPDSSDPTGTVHANAGPDQIVQSGDVVILSGAASSTTTDEELDFSWRQVAGPTVQLALPHTVTATFTAPANYEDSIVLTFELTAFVEGASARDQVRVAVLPSDAAEEPVPDPALPSTAQLVTWMAELPPLPKVHYSFPLHPTLLGEPVTPQLYQYVRLTRAVSLSTLAKDWQISTAVTVCDQINDLNDGGLATSIAINHSPWHNSFPAELPPTYTGPEEAAEIDAFRQNLTSIRATLAAANVTRGTHIPVTAILLDTERFYVKEANEPGAAQWNAAIDAKYAPFYDIAKQIYPSARVEWYGRGIQESQGATGWSPFPWFTFNEPADTLACSLYRVSEIETMRETFRRTHELAVDLGFSKVTPWIALGAGYRRDAALFQVWQQDWDYDPVYSLLLGRELNQWWYATLPERYAPWDAAEAVVFYPAPFDPRSPAWGKHFVAYVRGAANRNDVP